MARYGTFKYGSGQEYGTSPTNANLLWTVIIDWDGDGFFSGENEAEVMIDFNLSRGRDHFVAPNGQGFEKYRAGKCSITLDNSDGRFNPFNTSSPLYPHVTPGKSVRIAVKNGSTSIDYSLMRGKISDIQPYNTSGRKLVKIDVIDGQQFLADKTVKIGFRQMGSAAVVDNRWSTGRWIDLILERANWPENEWPRTYDLITDYSDSEYQTLEFAWFWNRNAMDGVRELEDVEQGTFLHDRNGNAQFLSQNFTYNDIIEIDEAEVLTDITIPQPWETLRNRIEIVVNPIQLNVASPVPTVWSIAGLNDQAIPVAAESSFVADASFRYLNYNVIPSNYAIFFTVNSLADGTGTNLTSSCTVQISEIGDGATVTLLNNSVTPGFITSLYITGDPIYGAFESTMSTEDSTSADLYGSRVLIVKSPWMQEPAYAQDIADFLLENLKDPTPYPKIKIEARPSLQFPLDLYMDVIHLTSDELGINKLHRIGKIEHDWLNNNGQAVLTTLKLEPYFAVDAPIEFDYSLYSPFSNPDETDATPVSPPLMDWTLTDFVHSELISGALEIGYIRASLTASTEKTAITTISHVITANNAISYYYKYADTDAGIAGSEALILTVVTTESGTIINQAVPFIISVGSDWFQKVIEFPAENLGETITTITFTKPNGFSLADANAYIDSVGIGVIIG